MRHRAQDWANKHVHAVHFLGKMTYLLGSYNTLFKVLESLTAIGDKSWDSQVGCS